MSSRPSNGHGMEGESASDSKEGAFFEWLRKGGAHFQDIEIKEVGGCRGMYTRRAIKEGEILLRVPVDLCLYNTDDEDAFVYRSLNNWSHLFNYLPIVVRLMFEQMNADSRWRPFLDMFPNRVPSSTSGYSDSHKQMLIKSSAWNDFQEFATEYREEWEHLQSLDNNLNQYTKSQLYWAREMYFSRAFRGQCFGWEEKLVFIPLFDLCNHRYDASMSLRYNRESGSFEGVADRDIAANEEVTFYYGGHTNAYFLVYYGFTFLDNPIKTLRLPFKEFLNEQSVRYLATAKYIDALFTLSNDGNESFYKMMAQLRAWVRDGVKTVGDVLTLYQEVCSYDEEHAVHTLLLDLCDRRLAQLPENIEQRIQALLNEGRLTTEQFNEYNLLNVYNDEALLLKELRDYARDYAGYLLKVLSGDKIERSPLEACPRLEGNQFWSFYSAQASVEDPTSPISRIAPCVNAFSFLVDEEIFSDIKSSYLNHIKPFLDRPENSDMFTSGQADSGSFGEGDQRYYYTNTLLPTRTMYWFSIENRETLAKYQQFLDRTGLLDYVKSKKLVDYDRELRLYCGFIMICYQSDNASWHVDYYEGANAYTIICPIEIEADHGGLLYLDADGNSQNYRYKRGEGIFFGDRFTHSTQPFNTSASMRVQLSLTFGTDKMEYWDILSNTIGTQSRFMLLPCGHEMISCTSCGCLYKKSPELAECREALDWSASFIHFAAVDIIKHHPWGKTIELTPSLRSQYRRAYLKILPPTRAQEALIAAKLYDRFPKAVPNVIAYDVERGFLLLEHHGGEDVTPDSIRYPRELLLTWADLQAEAKLDSELLSVLLTYDPCGALQDLLHCLQPNKSNLSGQSTRESEADAHTPPLKIGTFAKEFIGAEEAAYYWGQLSKHRNTLEEKMAPTLQLPLTLIHGDLQWDNVAVRPDGQIVIYDWGEAVAAPAGLSISNPLLFRSLTTVLDLLSRLAQLESAEEWSNLVCFVMSLECTDSSLKSVIGEDGVYACMLIPYIERLVEKGYASKEQLLESLPGSFLSGAMRWLVSWSMEVGYSEALKEVAGGWWLTSLDALCDYLSRERVERLDSVAPIMALSETECRHGANISLIERGNDRFLERTGGQTIAICDKTACVWNLLYTPCSPRRLSETLAESFPDSDSTVVKLYAVKILASLLDKKLIDID